MKKEENVKILPLFMRIYFTLILILTISNCVVMSVKKRESLNVEHVNTIPYQMSSLIVSPRPIVVTLTTDDYVIGTSYVGLKKVISSPFPSLTFDINDTSCDEEGMNLYIQDRDEDPEAPKEGWCGETCIQMALQYYGKNISQREINEAGHSVNPDLRGNDIPIALDNLGVNYNLWDEDNPDLEAFIAWLKSQLEEGYPVLVGVKIYPDKHPYWSADHFVLVVGCNSEGILINSNNAGKGQIWLSYRDLETISNYGSVKSIST